MFSSAHSNKLLTDSIMENIICNSLYLNNCQSSTMKSVDVVGKNEKNFELLHKLTIIHIAAGFVATLES
ncbi:hypothetical protein T06_12767 [Trichinella sp. T6]|nr:hypothetical protein T06_12767 [Trichinella sp. T6]